MAQVFISHSTEDAAVARQVAAVLHSAGVAVWIAPDSILPGQVYNEAIVAGLRSSDILAVLVSRAANNSKHVAREVGLADSHGKRIVPIRIEAVEPSDGLAYYLSLPQWVEWHAEGPAALKRVIAVLGGSDEPKPAKPQPSPPSAGQGAHQGAYPGAQGGATIRIYRPPRGSYAARMIAILIDGQKIGEIGNGATVDFTVAPGRRDIAARVDYVKSRPLEVDAAVGRVRSLELVVPEMADIGGQVAGLLGQSSFFTWKLID